jgi:hypothetical protein
LSDLFEASGRVLVQQARDQRLIRQPLRRKVCRAIPTTKLAILGAMKLTTRPSQEFSVMALDVREAWTGTPPAAAGILASIDPIGDFVTRCPRSNGPTNDDFAVKQARSCDRTSLERRAMPCRWNQRCVTL